MEKSLIHIARECIHIEQKALESLANHLENSFEECVNNIFETHARVVCTGIGKSALIAQKIVATLNSTGTAAVFLHAADALHGDIGLLNKKDVLMCFSKSGETDELKLLIPLAKNIGSKIVAITANKSSYLGKQADYTLFTPIETEADHNNLAPTASTAAQLALGDAIAVCLMHLRGFTPGDFAKFHPGGSLGKQLYLKVSDVYIAHGKPENRPQDRITEAILVMSKFRLGATVITNEQNQPIGIITDGDLRRMIEKYDQIQHLSVAEVMHPEPKTIEADALAIDALQTMRTHNISQLVVTRQLLYVGLIHIHDLIKEGLM